MAAGRPVRVETPRLPHRRYHAGMSHSRTIANLEADIVALRAAADRAGTALACLFSSSDEFEAEVVRVRREQGAYEPLRRRRSLARIGTLTALLVALFLMI